MQVYNKQILTNVVLSADRASTYYNVQQIYGVAIQATITGTPTGSFKLQASCDPATSYNGVNNPPTHWTDIDNSSISVSAAGSIMWNIFDIMYNYIRVVYTDGSSGSSTAVANAVINAKGP